MTHKNSEWNEIDSTENRIG